MLFIVFKMIPISNVQTVYKISNYVCLIIQKDEKSYLELN